MLTWGEEGDKLGKLGKAAAALMDLLRLVLLLEAAQICGDRSGHEPLSPAFNEESGSNITVRE